MGIANLFKKYSIAFILSIGLAILHFSLSLSNSGKIQPIKGDAQAYYAYLPALFIYNDLDYQFIEKVNQKYYPKIHQKSFLVNVNGEKVNKTFPGAALYYAPFFSIAHLGALCFGLEADGYSTIYQVLFDFGYWFYFFLSLFLLIKIFSYLNYSKTHINWAIVFISLGTNIFFYTVFNQSVTHVFNFFTINWIIYLLLRFQNERKSYQLILSFALLAILGITRPTNILVIFILPIFLDLRLLASAIISTFKKIKPFVFLSLLSASILFIPFALWKAQTGHWIVYSYGDEGFNFSNPEIFNFIFSYTKGWFLYTPIAFMLITLGIPIIFSINKNKAAWIVISYSLSIYLFASWWCWYYGAGQSQRVMIDSSIILVLLMLAILKFLAKKRNLLVGFLTICVAFSSLNMVQAFQISKGILPHGSPTKAQYWDNFLSLERKAKVYPKEHWVLEKEKSFNLTPEVGDVFKGNSYFKEDGSFIQVSSAEPFSGNILIGETNFTKATRFIISFEAKAEERIEGTRVVLDFKDHHEPYVYHFGDYILEGEWSKIELLFEPSNAFNSNPLLYFWNGGTDEKVEIRDIRFTQYSTPNYM